MSLAKSSMRDRASATSSSCPTTASRDRALRRRCAPSTSDACDAVLEIVEARELLDRHPVLQQSIRLRNPYVDPMNAIQVELLRRWRGR